MKATPLYTASAQIIMDNRQVRVRDLGRANWIGRGVPYLHDKGSSDPADEEVVVENEPSVFACCFQMGDAKSVVCSHLNRPRQMVARMMFSGYCIDHFDFLLGLRNLTPGPSPFVNSM